MNRLYMDFETASELDLELRGLANYVHHPSTRALMLAFAFDDGAPDLWEPPSPFPARLLDALGDPFVTKVAYNATFERSVFRHIFHIEVPYMEWIDPMICARYMSIPGKLADAGRVLGLQEDEAKSLEGKRLIKMFCEPVHDQQVSPLFGAVPATFRDRRTDPDDWKLFGLYCRQDVAAERAVLKKLAKFRLPPLEQRMWILDQIINDRGMPCDIDVAIGGGKIADETKTELNKELFALTGLENPNSRDQMLEWAKKQGYPFGGLGKAFVQRSLTGEGELTDLCKQVLTIRKQASKTSDTKLERIRDVVCEDGRLRHQFNFMGAARAGRWTGSDVQLQNMPRPVKAVEKNLGRAIELLKAGDLAAVKEFFGPLKTGPLDVVVSCIRSAFRAPEGQKLVVCDLNAIENRVLGWVAHCDKILEVFRLNRCPYLSFGCLMTGQDYDETWKKYKAGDSDAALLRQNSKPAVLGCGYRLGGGEEIINLEGDKIWTGLWGYGKGMGVDLGRDKAHADVKFFRDMFREVKQLWYDLEGASFRCLHSGPQEMGRVRFEAHGGDAQHRKLLRITLPSGRSLHYIRPQVLMIPFGADGEPKKTLTYEGIDQKTKQWTRIGTHGGKLTENIVQAIARDLLVTGLLNSHERGFEIVGHCHDEIITLTPNDSPLHLADLRDCMIAQPEWASDLPLDAEGYESVYYKKG